MDDSHDALAVYRQTDDGVPLFNGFSGYAAPHQYAMREMLKAADPRILRALTSGGPIGVIIDHDADEEGALRKFVAGYPGATEHETHPGWSSYLLPGGNGTDPVPDESGTLLAIKGVDAFPSAPHAVRAIDGDLRTRWSGGVQQSAADFTIELAEPGRVRQVVTDLGEFWGDFPTRLQLDVSADGVEWETVFAGDTVLQAYYAALRHPKRVPVVYPIDRDHVRFIRLKQLGWGRNDWSIAELHVRR